MKECRLMIYGANGYAGALMVREAVKQGIRPVIAGRSAEKLKDIAEGLGLECRAFAVEDAGNNLQDIGVVLNCAGPFSTTSEALLGACLKRRAHYLDITGEIDVFRRCHGFDNEARRRNIIVMPGVGADIVPTDCLAAMLKERRPDAVRIDLAFSFGSAPSMGTVKTALESFGKGGLVWENRRLRSVPDAFRIRKIPFQDKPRWAATVPWGDVFTMGISTNVPNGMVYMAMPKAAICASRLANPIKGALNTRFVRKMAESLLGLFIGSGPGEDSLKNDRGQFWGEASAPNGDKVEMTISTPNVYRLTAMTGVRIAGYCLAERGLGGYYTPSMLLGGNYIASIPDVDIRMA